MLEYAKSIEKTLNVKPNHNNAMADFVTYL